MSKAIIIYLLIFINAVWVTYRVRNSKYGLGISLGIGAIPLAIIYYIMKPRRLYVKYPINIGIAIVFYLALRLLDKTITRSSDDFIIISASIALLLLINLPPFLIDHGKKSAKKAVINLMINELQIQHETAKTLYNRIAAAGLKSDVIEMKVVIDSVGSELEQYKLIEIISMIEQNYLTFNNEAQTWKLYSHTYNKTLTLSTKDLVEFYSDDTPDFIKDIVNEPRNNN